MSDPRIVFDDNNMGELNQPHFHVDIVVTQQKVMDVDEIVLSITDGLGNLSDIHIALGIMGTVGVRVASPLEPAGPDMSFKLFDAEIR